MLNRLTISTLLKAAIALCGIAVITLLSFSMADSWSRMRVASKAAAATTTGSAGTQTNPPADATNIATNYAHLALPFEVLCC